MEPMHQQDMVIMEWCKELPKIELHAHLNGCIRHSTICELAKKLGAKGVINLEEFEHVTMKNSRSLLNGFKLFDLVHMLTTDHETVTRITKEVVEDFAADNVIYLELRTTPKKNDAKRMTKRSYMKAVIDGLKAIKTVDIAWANSNLRTENCFNNMLADNTGNPTKRKKIYVGLLVSINRCETTTAAMETVDLAMELKDFGVIGIDLSGNPTIGEWQTFLPALKHAKQLGLPITLHCGEVPNRMEINDMIDILPERIGHACYLEQEQWEKVISSRIPVEICLTSNVRTKIFPSIYEHHFGNLYKIKHPMALCTDDCGLFSTTLSNEYYIAASAFGLGRNEVFLLAQATTEFLFADNQIKKELKKIYEDEERKLLI